jgi:hypothetical protein
MTCDGKTNYQDQANQTMCLPMTACNSTEYQSQAPSTSTNRVCSSCGSCDSTQFIGTNCTNTTNTVCTNCTTCASGSFELKPCTPTSNRVCSSCVPGCLACPSGVCQSCNTSTYLFVADNATVLCVGNCSSYPGYVTQGSSCAGM